MSTRRLLLLLLSLAIGLGSLWPSAAPTAAQASCSFNLGFKAIRDQIPGIVGQCVEDERFNPVNGNAEQRTTGGLLVWRKADNWTAFTDGATTWLNGPFGLQSRPNLARFDWEAPAPGQPVVRAPAALAGQSEQQASATQSGWATVVNVTGPSTLVAENAAGERLRIWQLGVIGPTQEQGNWAARATEEHRRLVAPGARVWLEAEPGLEAPIEGVALRHVLPDGDASRPIGAELLRGGMVWVYPHNLHAYVTEYADRQAEAVRSRAGAWAETGSSAIFLPRGESQGGFPVNPRVVPALEALDRNEAGHRLLVQVNRFPVEIGVARTGPGEIGFFIPRYYSIQLGELVMTASAESLAAVLIHELTHTRQMIDSLVERREIGCYESEVEAFNVAAEYWQSLYGQRGKVPPVHELELELNETLRQYRSGNLAERVGRSYGHQCAGR